MNSTYTRIEWIDMAKGYGIILVLIGHSNIPIITPYLYTFHMPLFFFLSGCVSSMKHGFGPFLFHKIRKILIPYFFLSIPMIIANLYFKYGGSFSIDNLQTEIKNFVIQERHTTLWFLSSLFVLYLLFYPIVKYLNSKKQYLVVSFIAIMGLLLWQLNASALPWNCDISFVVLPFLFIGYRMKVRSKNISAYYLKWYVGASFFIMTGLLGFINYSYTGSRVDLFYSKYAIEPLSYFTSFVGITAMLILSMKTNNSVIKYIGKNSLLYFAWHQTIIFPLIEKTSQTLNIFQNISSGYAWILYAIIPIILSIIIISLLNELILRSKFSFIIGR